jgi:hypothetical protein
VEDKSVSIDSDGTFAFYLFKCFNYQALVSKTRAALGQWYFVATTWDGATAALYVDGKLESKVTEGSCNVSNNSGPVYIGQNPETHQQMYKGDLDDLRVYQRALSAAEVRRLYQTFVPPAIQGTAPWQTTHTVRCDNLTQGTHVTIPATKAGDWNCEAAGLQFNPDDEVRVTIDGTKL